MTELETLRQENERLRSLTADLCGIVERSFALYDELRELTLELGEQLQKMEDATVKNRPETTN